MARWLPSLLSSALALSVAPAAPALKPKGLAYLYPTTVGARWTYMMGEVEATFVVTRVDDTDGAFTIDVASVESELEKPCQQMRVSSDGLFQLSLWGTAYQTPECLVKTPHADGQTWETIANGVTVRMTAVRRETVETPAGRFRAIRVERDGIAPATLWYAEGVGLVKFIYSGGEQVLKSYTTGKK